MSVFVGYSFLRTSLLEVTISFCPPSESVESVDTAMYRRVILLEWFTPSKLSVMEPFVFGCFLGSFIFSGLEFKGSASIQAPKYRDQGKWGQVINIAARRMPNTPSGFNFPTQRP